MLSESWLIGRVWLVCSFLISGKLWYIVELLIKGDNDCLGEFGKLFTLWLCIFFSANTSSPVQVLPNLLTINSGELWSRKLCIFTSPTFVFPCDASESVGERGDDCRESVNSQRLFTQDKHCCTWIDPSFSVCSQFAEQKCSSQSCSSMFTLSLDKLCVLPQASLSSVFQFTSKWFSVSVIVSTVDLTSKKSRAWSCLIWKVLIIRFPSSSASLPSYKELNLSFVKWLSGLLLCTG